MADRPGVLAAVTRVLDEQGVSIKSFVQRGRRPREQDPAASVPAAREDVRLVMVIHPLAESRLREALACLGELDFVRSAPRAIRVIEEEFL